MKKIVLTLAALFVCAGAFAQSFRGEKSAGISINYGTEIETVGFGFNFNYNITDEIRLNPNFTYFLKKNDVNIWDVNVDVNYLFDIAPWFKAYPVAGLSLATAHWSVIYTAPGSNHVKSKSNETRFGVNIGAGFEYDIAPDWAVNFQIKYRIMSDIDQAVIGVGVLYKW